MEPAYLAQASPISYSIGSIPYYGSDTPILLKPMVLALPLFSHAVQSTLSPIDLWVLPETRLSHSMMDCLGNAFYSHCPEETRPPLWRWTSMLILGPNAANSKRKANVDSASEKPPSSTLTPSKDRPPWRKWLRNPFARVDAPKDNGTVESLSLNYAHIFFGMLHSMLFWCWWLAGLLKLVGGESPPPHTPLLSAEVHAPDMLQTTTPLINKLLLMWLAESHVNHHFSTVPSMPLPQGIGYGIGLAVTLFMMQGECGPGYMHTSSPFPHAEVSSLVMNQYNILTMTNGMTICAGVSVVCRCFPPCSTLMVGHT